LFEREQGVADFKLTLLARQDLWAIHDYIAANNPKTAKRYIVTLKETCQNLADTPGIGVSRQEYHGLYKFPVGDYLIFYRTGQNGIEVIRILHGSRDVESIFKDAHTRPDILSSQ
jgi:toxin ParE1/3/4